ncbi:MAPEG family protein [Nitratireductor mangrovi]|uniref:Microsomal glutathione S-transferase 1 n=1 Tax=Nitratireductor mangrovi TaxID=2599600 RepID=A0A5B8L0P6_9HYPH|nr:MAPEG family protein [Nitratireductor mangrovi]QDZ01148.1 MAPEG family protein [Nitratireductor mangrovi]
MEIISLSNPVFAVYAIAASLMILKVVAMSWLTVARMMQENAGLRAPEDLKPTRLNPKPDPSQLLPNERVERVRRIQANDLENVPFFLAAGFLYTLTAPPLWLAQLLFYGYAITRFAHFAAYFTGQIHDIRAALWTPGSLIIIFMSLRVLLAAFGI